MGMAPVIDFHTHILPGIDDGSRNTQMSLDMLDRMTEQDVNIAVATPHFYGHHENIEHFLEKRSAAYARLQAECGESRPRILLGAEVAFSSSLCDFEGLERLCIENTNVLLLEMPFIPWTSYEYDALSTLCLDRRLQIVLAHYERFARLQKNNEYYERILRLPVKVQINAESLLPLFQRGRWIAMFRENRAQLLGSDSHDLTQRVPNLGMARKMLVQKLGEAALEKLDMQTAELLQLKTTAVTAV